MDTPPELKDAPLLIQADWHEEHGDVERAQDLRRTYARQNPNANEGWCALLKCLDQFVHARHDQWVAIREMVSEDETGISVAIDDGDVIVQIMQLGSPNAWISSEMLGVLHRYGVAASVEELCTNSGDVVYWTAYRVGCGRDSRKAAAVVRDLLREYKPDLGLEEYRFRIEPE